MANETTVALGKLGVDVSVDNVNSLGAAISQFNEQNLSPQDIARAAASARASGPLAVSGVSSATGGFPLSSGAMATAAGGQAPSFGGSSGEFQSIRYAHDLNRHHPKFKFLFKVKFEGFHGVENFEYFVHRCDKPRVKFNHQDVNYYNFRTRVLTHVSYDQLNISFLDEIGDSVNTFFKTYLAGQSGTGTGYADIDRGFGDSTSSRPYEMNRGYSTGQRITIEQVFGNGSKSNRFHFINPRIESFEFDDLSMEESIGSMLMMSFSYDAIECETVSWSVIHDWGETDLLRGGGTSGPSGGGGGQVSGAVSYALGGTGGGAVGNPNVVTAQPGVAYGQMQQGLKMINTVPGAIADMVTGVQNIVGYSQPGVVSSSQDTLNSSIQGTLQSIISGSNLSFSSQPSNVETYTVDITQPTLYGLDP